MMLKKIYNGIIELPRVVNHILNISNQLADLKMKIESQSVLIGNLQSKLLIEERKSINDSEFKVFSQFGDDGIIQYLIQKIDIGSKTFIEFGVENYTESNTRFLLLNNNWKGMVMDGSQKNIDFIKKDDLYWRHDLTAVKAFIDKDNINNIINENGFSGDLGILHIDIDGNDYWVWDSVTAVNPEIVIVEYNSVFGFDNPWTVQYDPKFVRSDYNHNNLYWGVSLLSLCELAEQKGYDFVGCNDGGNNAYFVRKDKMKKLIKLTPEQGYKESKFREALDAKGNLSYLSGTDRLAAIKGMEVYNTRLKKTEKIQ